MAFKPWVCMRNGNFGSGKKINFDFCWWQLNVSYFCWLQLNVILLFLFLIYTIKWAGGGMWPEATTFFPLMPHIFFLVSQNLSLPAVTTFLNDKVRALKLEFLKILPYLHAKIIPLWHFLSLLKINELCFHCSGYKLFYIIQRNFYIILRIVGTETNCWGSLKKKKRWEKLQY